MRTRITILATAVVLVALLLGSFALLGLFRRALLHSQSGEVEARAQAVAALAVDGALPDPLPSLDTPHLTLIQVLGADGTVVAASGQLAGTPALRDPGPQRRKVVDDIDGVRGGPWLTEVAVVPIGGQDRTVVVITSLSGYARGADLLRTSLLVIVPILLLIVAVTVWLVVGRALRPVEAMRTEAESITGRQLDRRVPIPPTGDEIARLAVTLNDMLDRLQASSDAQRRFVADASHELRTPIANIRMAIEVAVAHPDRADWPTVADDVLLQDQRMQHLTDDLLTLARADAGSEVLRIASVDVTALLQEELARPLPPGRLLVAEGALPAIQVPGDGEQLRRVVTNLVDNALRHAEQTVTIGLRAVPVSGRAMVEIRVSDDGPGVPLDDRDKVFDPFVRLDQHRARQQGGAGLGLSIVSRVVQAHHGSVTVTGAGVGNGGGATFVVLLPAIVPTH
ncbi:MAG: histidine kinase [Ilumatobacteraceae bacterium]|nr:histidine kinase [Ilumatobacteraceae bacterium]